MNTFISTILYIPLLVFLGILGWSTPAMIPFLIAMLIACTPAMFSDN